MSLVCSLCPSILVAQSFTGTITGTIKDTSGAVVPRATVTITNQQTGRQETVVTDLEGRYTSLPLPPGEYRVEAGLQGFRRAARTDIAGADQRTSSSTSPSRSAT